MITISAFRWVPTFARGLVRDLRVRWALEEAGLPYEAWLIGPDDQKSEAYRSMQPFGQVPAYEEDGLVLFESGAILLHIADRSEVLMPTDPKARSRVTAWMFAALNSVEPHIQNLTAIDLFHAEEDWAKQRRPAALKFAQTRLTALSDWLDGRGLLCMGDGAHAMSPIGCVGINLAIQEAVATANIIRLKTSTKYPHRKRASR
jgi:glutathione S-transferase